MKTRACLLALIVSPSLVAGHPAAPSADDLIPRAVFFGNPQRTAVQISPGGDRISYLAPVDGVLNVWVENFDGTSARAVTSATDRPIRQYFWAHNGEQVIYARDRDGDENFRLYAVDTDDGAEVELTPFDGVQARLIARDPRFPDELLIGLNNRRPQVHDVWRVNTRTGEAALVYENDGNFASLLADSDFEIRLASRFRADGGLQSFMRDAGASAWYELAHWGHEDAATSGPLGFSSDGRTVYLGDSRHGDTSRLYALTTDPELNEWRYELLAEHPRADLGAVVFDPRTGKPQAAAFEHERREWRILDQSIIADWRYLGTVADGEMNVVSRDGADDTWIVSYVRDNGPVEYYVYDRAARRAEFLFSNRSDLMGLELARMTPLTIRARDGLPMVSYLTTPPGRRARNLPMVLLVHGGPWARDRWGYNPIHQWLANRGYAVLSVNFRGSTGFGKRYINAANREWAGAMHNDLIDAVNWAVEEQIADPDRVAIMGGSYGGYATLVGLTFTPEFFACGVDIVGPSHVRTLLESIPPYWEPIKAMFETRVGRLDEPEHLDSISPLTRVDAIQRPLLIGQGANDPRVKVSESEQIVAAMQEKGLPVTYVVFPDEGHGFARPTNNLAFFAMTEAFLAQHLGGKAEPITSEIRESSADIQAGAELIESVWDVVDLP